MRLPKLTTVAAALAALLIAAPGIAAAADPMGVDDGTELTLWTRAATQVRVDALVSLNGRKMSRLIDPNLDLSQVSDGLGRAGWILAAPTEPPPPIRPI